MNRVRKMGKQCLLWMIPGILSGCLMAALCSAMEYRTFAETAGSALASESLAQGLKNHSDTDRPAGIQFLERYGYHPLGNFGAYLPFTIGMGILFFQAAGMTVFVRQYRSERKGKQRIEELTEYLRAVNAGNGAVLCREEDAFSHLEDEIYKTVTALQSTKESAVKNHRVLSERIADIAHQLKTPLTSMSLMTELLEEYRTAETEEYLTRLSMQIEHLKHLVSGLLSLAKLDSHEILFQKEELEMYALLEAASEPLQEMMAQKRITLSVRGQGGGSCQIYADRQWTEEALLNLLKNCVEHTPEGGGITAVFQETPLYASLILEDSGPGFSAKDLPHLFERFYRGEHAAKDHAGIGLALAKAVLEQQNGQLRAENTADGHARFSVKWYLFADGGPHSPATRED